MTDIREYQREFRTATQPLSYAVDAVSKILYRHCPTVPEKAVMEKHDAIGCRAHVSARVMVARIIDENNMICFAIIARLMSISHPHVRRLLHDALCIR